MVKFFAMILIVSVLISPLHAESLYGRTHAMIGGGMYRPGGNRTSLNPRTFLYLGEFSLLLHKYANLRGALSYTQIGNGVVIQDHTWGNTDILFHFARAQKLRPAGFVGIDWLQRKYSFDGSSETRSGAGIRMGLACELDVSEKYAVHFESAYSYTEGKSDLNIGTDFVIWLGESSFLPLAVMYGFDDEDLTLTAQLGFAF